MENEIYEQQEVLSGENSTSGVQSANGNTTEQLHSSPITEKIVPSLKDDDELLELSDDFNFDDFQVVRREFFAHLREPSITFNECKFSVNTACLTKFSDCEYAQVLVNQSKKILAIRPCTENARDAYLWCGVNSKGKRTPKAITCKLFFAKIVELMNWNPRFRYKLLGKIIHAKGEYMIAFDLTATEVYQKVEREGQPAKTSRTATYPADWQHQFGLPYNEHKQSLQINIFDGYAIYAIKEPAAQADDVLTPPAMLSVAQTTEV